MSYRNSLFAAFLFTTLASGCAQTSTQMVNDKGQVADCGAWGFGIIGAPAALVETQNCVDKYQAAGWHEAGVLPNVPAALPQQQIISPSPQQQVESNGPVFMTSKDGSFKIVFPAGWAQSEPPKSTVQLFAKNTVIDAGLFASSVNVSDIKDWNVFAGSLKEKVASSLSDSSTSDVRSLKINGYEALETDIKGTAKNSMNLHYIGTLIKTDRKYILVLSWCLESRFSANRDALEQLPKGLQV